MCNCMGQWIKTSDRLPEGLGLEEYEYVSCLVVTKYNEVELLVWDCFRKGWKSHWRNHDISHWMPVPEVPIGDGS